MKPWFMLFGAITFEVIGITSLRASQGFSKPLPSVLVVIGYALSFFLVSQALKSIPLGTTYAVWSGIGTAATALIGVWLWSEAINPARIAGIVLIIAGVVLLNLNGAAAH